MIGYEPLIDKTKMTKTDIVSLIRKLKNLMRLQIEERNHKQQIKMLIETLQTFGSSAEDIDEEN